jgi:hypothetical protein
VIIEFPSKLDAAWLEGAIADSADVDGVVTMSMRRLRDIHRLGEGRLLQWMQELKRRQVRVVLDLGQSLPPIVDDPRHALWSIFQRRLGAMILVDAADEVRDGDGRDRRADLVSVQMAVLVSTGNEPGFGRERTLLRLDRVGAPPAFRPFVNRREDFKKIETRVNQLIRDGLNLKPLGTRGLQDLSSFVHELVANTRMHARDDLEGAPIAGMRFAQIRRLKLTRQPGMERLGMGGSRSEEYLARLSSHPDWGSRENADFVEVTVADSGVGIPARLRGSLGVYAASIEEEIEATREAMGPKGSSRSSSAPGRGLGLDTAKKMAEKLGGVAVVRTGRLELTRDSTLAVEEGEDGWQVDPRPYLPGTAISLLLPWWPGALQTQTEQQ